MIIGGDFNCLLVLAKDIKGGILIPRQHLINLIEDIQSEFNLHDILPLMSSEPGLNCDQHTNQGTSKRDLTNTYFSFKLFNQMHPDCGCFKVTLPRSVSRLDKNKVYSQVASEKCRLPEITIWLTKKKKVNTLNYEYIATKSTYNNS